MNNASPTLVPILYSEVFGAHAKPTRDTLRQLLAQLDWRFVVMFSAGIASISWQRGIEDPRQQQDLVMNTVPSLKYGERVLAIMAAEPHRRLYTRDGLFGIIRVAVDTRTTLDGSPTNVMDLLVQSILMANELTSDELLPASITHTAVDLTKSEVRSQVLRLQNPHDLLARTDAFMRWSESEEARRSPDHLPIAADIERFFGITWPEYAASAYVMLSRYAALTSWEAVEQEKIFFAPEPWLRNIRDDAAIRRWLAASTIGLGELTTSWRQEESISFASAGPLWRRPMVETGEGLFSPSPALLTNAMGEGVYFALFDSYGTETGDSTKKLRLSRFYGDFFEAYVTGILERSYAGRPGINVHQNIRYSGGESTDVIILENGDAFFFEVVAKRMKVIESILKLDEQAILDDIAAGVAKKIAELDKHIANFKGGSLLPDTPRPDGQRIFPIIVSPMEWPRIRVLSETVPALERTKGYLLGVEPLELLDIGEIETLENELRAGLRLGELLVRKNRSSRQNRMMTLNNYLIYIEPQVAMNEPSPTRVRGSEVAQEIAGIASTWFNAPAT